MVFMIMIMPMFMVVVMMVSFVILIMIFMNVGQSSCFQQAGYDGMKTFAQFFQRLIA